MVMEKYTLPHGELLYALPHGHNNPNRLMTWIEWGAGAHIPFHNIRSANTTGSQLY
jgi:hypothetical protein